MNSPPSISTVTPIGRPVASRPRIVAQCGRSKCTNSSSGANRFERDRYAVNASTCTHSMIAEAMPRQPATSQRSEERRVGIERVSSCRYWCSKYNSHINTLHKLLHDVHITSHTLTHLINNIQYTNTTISTKPN